MGVKIDNKLTFEEQAERLCKKASQKVNALARISSLMRFDQRNKLSVCSYLLISEAVVQGCSVKKVVLKILLNSQENTLLLKKRPWHRCCPVNPAKFSRIPFL